MALFSVKLSIISRVFFFAFVVAQAFLLSKFVVDHCENGGFYGLPGLFVIPLLYWARTLKHGGLKYRLGHVWLFYSCVLVIMIGVIYGRIVIEDNKLREQEIATCLCTPNVNNTTTKPHSFFDSKFLKITLCFTPGLMLLLLTSVTDESETLKQLYYTTVMDLYDGVEMLEVLHEDVCDKIPKGWEIAVLVAALLFFLLSFLEVHQIEFEKPSDAGQSKTKEAEKPKTQKTEAQFHKERAVANTVFQIILNLSFLFIRSVLWLHYDFDSVIFLAKNVIALVITVVDILEASGYIITKSDKIDLGKSDKKAQRQEEVFELGISNTSLST